ncbi:hypothetical protein GA830_05960 [Mesorhizobium sp. NBSH29]|nr:hypothetical protein GA830_05960 [Mesorhizobium sp. NBSH29]
MSFLSPPPFIFRLLAAGIMLLATGAASVAEGSTALPGVEGGYRIVKPVEPQPEPDEVRPADAIGVGEWDVKVSGSVSVDIGTMKPRR